MQVSVSVVLLCHVSMQYISTPTLNFTYTIKFNLAIN